MLSFLMLQRVKRTVTTGFIKDYVNNTRRLNRASIENLIPVVYDRSQLIYWVNCPGSWKDNIKAYFEEKSIVLLETRLKWLTYDEMVGFYGCFAEPSGSVLHDRLNLTDEGTSDSRKLG